MRTGTADHIFWYDALKDLPASQVGVLLYIEPLVTLVVTAIILSEQVTLASILGGITIILGVWLVNRPRPERMPALAEAQAEEPG